MRDGKAQLKNKYNPGPSITLARQFHCANLAQWI
jgi:hypothetical protein